MKTSFSLKRDRLTLPGDIGWLDSDPLCDCREYDHPGVGKYITIHQDGCLHADATAQFLRPSKTLRGSHHTNAETGSPKATAGLLTISHRPQGSSLAINSLEIRKPCVAAIAAKRAPTTFCP
ncbi:hypothetical protein KCP78_15370 [Salmonella enterica subsp. enterica]|nr:hypothetical protein KCP78_15370 [Salmonella enterica subsp. enterica]